MTDPIARAVHFLRAGGLVAFPTETVYGLGADATNPQAVQRIFSAKGRPSTNPLIVHVADERTARRYAGAWPQAAASLARVFWPGPLTLVVPRSNRIAPIVSAGRETVGLRSPDHPLARALLEAFDGAIAAPSANRSNRVSPTTAEHVRKEFGNAIDLILDGGPCRVGIESTVLDLTGAVPIILRPGSVSRDQLAAEIGGVELFAGSIGKDLAAASPGQQAVHYAPNAPAYRFGRDEADRAGRWCRTRSKSCAALLLGSPVEILPAFSDLHFHRQIWLSPSPSEYAKMLYAALRDLDVPQVKAILVELPPDEPQWTAVRDRLMRATKPSSDMPGD